jgi:hypothetical protein
MVTDTPYGVNYDPALAAAHIACQPYFLALAQL